MTGRNAPAPALFAPAGNLAASIARSGHHYHGAFWIALAVFALLVIAGLIVLVAGRRRPAGTRLLLQRVTEPRPAHPPSRVRAVAGAICWRSA